MARPRACGWMVSSAPIFTARSSMPASARRCSAWHRRPSHRRRKDIGGLRYGSNSTHAIWETSELTKAPEQAAMHWERLLEDATFDLRRSGRFLVADLKEPHQVLSTSARHG